MTLRCWACTTLRFEVVALRCGGAGGTAMWGVLRCVVEREVRLVRVGQAQVVAVRGQVVRAREE